MDPTCRCNLAAFMARLTALDVFNTELSSSGLVLVKETFEVPRPLMEEEGSSEVSKSELGPVHFEWM